MKYLYSFTVIVIVAAGIAVSVFFSKQSVSVTRVAYKAYASPSEMVSVMSPTLMKSLQEAPLLLLGVIPGHRQDLEFWQTFLEQIKTANIAYQVVVVDPKLPFANEMFPTAVKVDLKNEMDRLSEGARNASKQGLRMVVIAPTVYTTQAIEGSAVNVLIQTQNLKPTSLSIVPFPRTASEEASEEVPCTIGEQNKEGTGAFGCMIQKRARSLYKTKSTPGKFEGLVDQLGEKDFLVFWNPPKP